MSRITGREVSSLMEAYSAVYNPDLREELIFEEFLTEEFILEAYQYVADFLVSEGHVPGYETAELFMSEMDETWIDEILCDYGLYLNEGPFGNFANTVIGGAKRAAGAVAGGVRKVAGAADRGVAGAVRAGQAIKGTAQRAAGAVARGATAAGQAAVGGAQRAGQAVVGGAQRAGGAVVRAATPVAQAVKGTAQRAVAAGQSVLGGAARAVQGAGQAVVGGAQRAGQAVVGGAQRAASAVSGAAQGVARRVGQEIEISRKVGAGEPLSKPAPVGAGAAGRKVAPTAAARPAAAAPAARPAAAAPAARPAAAAPAAPKRQSLASQAAELRQMRAASQARQGITAGFEPQGEDIQEIPLVVAAPLVAGGLYAAGKGMEALKSKADSAINKARKTSAIGGDRRVPQMNSYDMFDAVLEYLVAEGYADTNQDALKIMANMTEEERTAVIEQAKFTVTALDKKLNTPAYKRFKEGNPAYQAGGEGDNKLVKGV